MSEYICKRCGKSKPLEEMVINYHKRRNCQYINYCCECHNLNGKESKLRRKGTRKQLDEYAKAKRKNKYGITQQQYDEMLINQNNCCAICGDKFTHENVPSVDHNHKTKEVRGLLCDPCNNGLGRFKENPNILRKAAKYLEEGVEEHNYFS
jgi:hypothetical protein